MNKAFELNYEWDIVEIRSEARELAKEIGFDEIDQAKIVQSISELARNVIQHAEIGRIEIEKIDLEQKLGIRIRVSDRGPGIDNFEEMMREQTNGIGETSGLHHVKLLMDDIVLVPIVEGSCVEVIKWLRNG
ncbi:ATP-binding protein [Hazenella sp. IB182357]|uniref:ATP-binding protein n=1 Tax=Polycladospora coralii TaxID=2771432 RepID=A0A926RTZ4_9BACL|nr:ATP-binding protein [Polycladospora coralii]MBD1373380.1 ATP-binding protein [Polycladospora coralii]